MKTKTLYLSITFLIISMGLLAGGVSELSTYPDGSPRHELTSLKGQLVKIVSYYRNGTVKEVGHYKNGVRHGSFVSFNENGKKDCAAYYYSDKKDGVWTFYNAEGNIERQVFFNQNFIVRANPFQVSTHSEFK